jgi:hypothetical protein
VKAATAITADNNTVKPVTVKAASAAAAKAILAKTITTKPQQPKHLNGRSRNAQQKL